MLPVCMFECNRAERAQVPSLGAGYRRDHLRVAACPAAPAPRSCRGSVNRNDVDRRQRAISCRWSFGRPVYSLVKHVLAFDYVLRKLSKRGGSLSSQRGAHGEHRWRTILA